MSTDEKINQLEAMIKNQGRTIEFILDHFKLRPDHDELEQAVASLVAGDPTALDSFIRRGGKIITEGNRIS